MNIGCCNECGYKANYIIDNNNYYSWNEETQQWDLNE